MGWSVEEVVDQYSHLSLAQVYAALAFYHANREAMDAAMAAEDAEADRLEREFRNPRAAERRQRTEGGGQGAERDGAQ